MSETAAKFDMSTIVRTTHREDRERTGWGMGMGWGSAGRETRRIQNFKIK